MTFSLCSHLRNFVRLGKLKIKIRPSFQTVLKCNTVLHDSVLSEAEKLEICLRLFVKHKYVLFFLSDNARAQLFKGYFEDFVNVGSRKNTVSKKVLDFSQDAAYIYSAFWQCYGVDLLGKNRNLHWWSFAALLGGLSDDTKMMQIVAIRSRPLPKPTKYNREERAELMKLKTEFAIKLTEKERKEQYQEGLAKLATSMEAWARSMRR